MQKVYIVIQYVLVIFLLTCQKSFSQIKVSTATLTGYEANINRLPNTFFNSVLLNEKDLHTNSFYQDVITKFSYSKSWKKNSIRIFAQPEARFYFSKIEGSSMNQLILNTYLNYRYSFKKYLKWDTNLQYKIKDRKGLDLDENEFSTPLGYNLIDFSTKLNFKLHRKNSTFVRLNYGLKHFNDTDLRSTSYLEKGVNFEYKNSNRKKKIYNSYGVIGSYSKRDYLIEKLDTKEEIERSWEYLNVGIFYKLPVTRRMSVTSKFEFEERIDGFQNQFGYEELSPSLQIEYRKKKLDVDLSVSYANRKFKKLNARNINGTKIGTLEFDSFRTTMNISYKLNKKTYILSEGYFLKRESNNTNQNTTFFRSYINYYVGIGFQYKF